MSKILFIGAEPSSLINFRGQLIKDLIFLQHEVFTLSSKANKKQIEILRGWGVKYNYYYINRSSLNIFLSLFSIIYLFFIIYLIKPKIIISYNIKPIIFSGILINIFFNKVAFYPLIEGLGYIFNRGYKRIDFLSTIAILLYKLSLAKARRVIFLNKDNANFFIDKRIINKNKIELIDGIGVDLNWYANSNYLNEDKFTFLCIARLLKDKGIFDYVEAAIITKLKFKNVRFVLLGSHDKSSNSVPETKIAEWISDGIIDYFPYVNDVRPYIKSCNVFVLPSYHEGMPRSIMEAMSMGRPILTTNASGCKETVIQGVNGFIINVGDYKALGEHMMWFLSNREKCAAMGLESRKIAEQRFNVYEINKKIINILKINN